MSRKKGRPMRYGYFILKLGDEVIYSVDRVINDGRKGGLFERPPMNAYTPAEARRKAFDSLSKFSKKHLPRECDGMVTNDLQTPLPGWYGWRWKLALPEIFQEDPERWLELEKRAKENSDEQEGSHKVNPKKIAAITLAVMLILVTWATARRPGESQAELNANSREISRELELVRQNLAPRAEIESLLRQSFFRQHGARGRHQYYQALKDLERLGAAPGDEPQSDWWEKRQEGWVNVYLVGTHGLP